MNQNDDIKNLKNEMEALKEENRKLREEMDRRNNNPIQYNQGYNSNQGQYQNYNQNQYGYNNEQNYQYQQQYQNSLNQPTSFFGGFFGRVLTFIGLGALANTLFGAFGPDAANAAQDLNQEVTNFEEGGGFDDQNDSFFGGFDDGGGFDDF